MPSTKVSEVTKDRIEQIALATKKKPEEIVEEAINDSWKKNLQAVRDFVQKMNFSSALFSDRVENTENAEITNVEESVEVVTSE